jgi:hypothetical protein
LQLNQKNAGEFELTSLLSDASSFTYAVISKGYFDDQNVFQGATLSLPETFLFAARGAEESLLKVLVVDRNGHTAEFIFWLMPVLQNYVVDFSSPHISLGFDRENVAQIVFVQDRELTLGQTSSLVQIHTKDLEHIPVALDPALQEVKDSLIQQGLEFFQSGVGVDPATRFPYDSITADGVVEPGSKFTQPTSIGFYAQILGDTVNQKIENTMTADQALTELNLLLDSLLDAQERFGWNGLIPWLNLEPYGEATEWIGLGDNANLAQSLAVMAGALEMADLTLGQRANADGVIDKVETFLDRQQPGYEAMIDPHFQIFAATVNKRTGIFNHFMDRLAMEFRGAIAFLVVRYPTLPDFVWYNLELAYADYTDRNGHIIQNLAAFDGGMFQMTWPHLRNNELDFLVFRNAIYNHLASQADFAHQTHLPGFLSASQRPTNDPGGAYHGRIGLGDIAELNGNDLVVDVGSTYAVASAYQIAPDLVLTWLQAIGDQLHALGGTYGFLDAARSNSEIAGRFLSIGIASTVLGLTDAGPEAFEFYLRSRGLELDYNLLYDRMGSRIELEKTAAALAGPPEFPGRSMAVFSRFTSEGTINSYPSYGTSFTGALFMCRELSGGYGGIFWTIPVYDAQANELEIAYTALDSPGIIKLELKNEADQTVYVTHLTLIGDNQRHRLTIQLPNDSRLSDVKYVVVIIDQNMAQDDSVYFYIHSINFRHLPSLQNVAFDPALGPKDLTTLPGLPEAQLISSNGAGSVTQLSDTKWKLDWVDLPPADGYAGISVYFDAGNTGQSADLSVYGELVFGLNSQEAEIVKVEIDDKWGRRAVFYAVAVESVTRYYKLMLTPEMFSRGVDLTKVERINFVVDAGLTAPPYGPTGSVELEIGGVKPSL